MIALPYNPRDLRISLRCATHSGQVYNGGPAGVSFPGWFIDAYQNEGYDRVIEVTQLTQAEVLTIAGVMDRMIDGPTPRQNRITNAVKTCDRSMRSELMRQLEAARSAANKIPDLERRLGLLS